MSVSRTVAALPFCLTLLGAPTVRAGSPDGRVDALPIPTLTLQSCIQSTTCDDGTPMSLRRPELTCTLCGKPMEPAIELSATVRQQLCDALKYVPLIPAPASCQIEPLQHAANDTTGRL